MTRPTPELEWRPDPVRPRTLSIRWRGAPWRYALEVGDNTVYQVRPEQWIRHTYAEPGGTFPLRAWFGPYEIKTTATVRPNIGPLAELVDLGAGRCRLRLRHWPAGEIRYRVDFDDDHGPVEFGPDNLEPERQYPAGHRPPKIEVVDLPARIVQRLPGPQIPDPPDPPPAPRFSWHVTDFPGDFARGRIHGAGLVAGTRVSARLYWSVHDEHDIHATVDPAGAVAFPEVQWVAGHPRFWPPWRSAKAWFPDHPEWGHTQIPLLMRSDETQAVVPAYTFDLADPFRLYLSVAAPMVGTYQVRWGDKSRAELVECDGLVLFATHRYSTGERVTIHLTDPAGRTGSRIVAPPEFYEPWVSHNGPYWFSVSTAVRDRRGADWYLPVTVDWGYPLLAPARPILHHPTAPDGRQNAIEHDYPAEQRGQQRTIRVYGPLRTPLVHTMTVPAGRARDRVRPTPPRVIPAERERTVSADGAQLVGALGHTVEP